MFAGALAAVLMQAAPVAAAPDPVTRPRWLTRPSTIDIMRAYPDSAARERIPRGDVVIDCRFSAAGELEDCQIASETPEGKGMGQAVLKLTPLYKADVLDALGVKVEGRRIRIPFTLAFAFAPPPEPPPPPPSLRQNGPPERLSAPTMKDFERAYPKRAAQLGIEGGAVLVCKSTPSGRLDDCTVARETPEDWGFGAAALSLAPKIRMRFKNMEGNVMDGGAVRIPINFKLPPPLPPATPRGG